LNAHNVYFDFYVSRAGVFARDLNSAQSALVSKVACPAQRSEETSVAVEGIDFQYRLIGNDDDDWLTGITGDDDVVKPQTTKASIDAAHIAIVSKLADLQKAVGGARH
jgi:hypothetical protein